MCWVADCEACDCPMVVWKEHSTRRAPADAVEHMMVHLHTAGVERFGVDGRFSIDRVMRQIPWHFHAHARDRGWQQRRWSSQPLPRYSGAVGGPRVLIGEPTGP